MDKLYPTSDYLTQPKQAMALWALAQDTNCTDNHVR